MYMNKKVLLTILLTGCISGAGAVELRMTPIPKGTLERKNGFRYKISPFSMLNVEITWDFFSEVKTWAENNGYDFSSGLGNTSLPVQGVTWYDAVKWCNALSEKEGKTPVYYTDSSMKEVYRSGETDITSDCVDWKSHGYRLPTETEWEYAYRAGSKDMFYWGNYKREDYANREYALFHYWGTTEMDGGPVKGGSKKPNAWSLYDMAGNMEEWVWDRYAVDYSNAYDNNPKGPDKGGLRVLRGGGFIIDSRFGAADRHPNFPSYMSCQNGFRIATSNPLDETMFSSSEVESTKPFNDTNLWKTYLRENTPEASARRIFPLLDSSSDELLEAFSYYDNGKYTDALYALNKVYTHKLRASSLEVKGKSSATEVERWMRPIEENRMIKWSGKGADISSAFDFGGGGIVSVFLKYKETKDRKYLDSYFNLVNQLALNSKETWNRLTTSEMGANAVPRESFYGYIGFDACYPLRQLAVFATHIKETPEGECPVPDLVMANVLYHSIFDCLATGLQDDRSNVPNQVWGNAVEIYKTSLICDNFRDSDLWKKEGEERLKRAARTVMKDGTDLEASINYNRYQIDLVKEINKMFAEPYPKWLIELNRRLEYRQLMFGSLLTPQGTYPSIGNQSDDLRPKGYVRRYLENGALKGIEKQVLNILDGKETPVQAPFTSVAFPYGGYYVQRSGWSKDDLYCFMRSGRDGVGHIHYDNNSLQLMAYGAYLLIDDGPPNYMRKDFMPEHQWNILPYFDENHVGNIFNTSNVGIEDNTQRIPLEVLRDPTEGWDTTRNLIFHTSDDIDIMEGDFHGYYESEQPLSDGILKNIFDDCGPSNTGDAIIYNNKLKNSLFERREGRHNRKVIFMRKEKFWIVVDDANGGYSAVQTWHLPPANEGSNTKSNVCPGFEDNQVVTDNKSKAFYTISNSRPNLVVRNFTPSEVVYNKYYGDKYPFRGWYSFNIVGERVPAVTMACTWKSEKPMLTLLYPVKEISRHKPSLPSHKIMECFSDYSHEDVAAMRYTGTDKERTVIDVQSVKTGRTSILTVSEVKTEASLLIVKQKENVPIYGIALDCNRLVYNGKEYKLHKGNYSFSFTDDGNIHLQVIKNPEMFIWESDNEENKYPVYCNNR